MHIRHIWMWFFTLLGLTLWLCGGGVTSVLATDDPPAPEIEAITPNWGAAGQVFSLTIEGKHLKPVQNVRFSPPIGIEVHNPPAINKDGTLATVEIAIMVHAPLGPRLVTLVTPDGESSDTPTEANIFRITFAHIH